MATQLHEVEFETRTIGPLVLTTPVLQRLEFRRIVIGIVLSLSKRSWITAWWRN